jgi:hypothetical protein
VKTTVAHNVIIWAQHWLASPPSALQQYGTLRMVRDVFRVSGFLLIDVMGRIRQIVLNQDVPIAPVLLDPLRALLAPTHVAICLGQT